MIERESIWVDLQPLSTGREHCLTLRTGPIDADTLRQAEVGRYDQLPVLDDADRLCGIIATCHVRALFDSREDLDPIAHAREVRTLSQPVDLFDLLSAFENERAVIFRQNAEDATPDDDWFALVTISDLNRHSFRSLLYPILAELESALAELIERHCVDPWVWLSTTSEDTQIHLIGRWEYEKRRSVDTSPIAGCTLIDMINIVTKSAPLRSTLGFSSRSGFKEGTGSIGKVRNQIMHPVRPLILEQDDVCKLQETLAAILRLTERTIAANAALIEQGRVAARISP